MRVLTGIEEKEAEKFLQIARELAIKSNCLRAKCGTVIVKTGKIIGKGFNSPPGDSEQQRRCLCAKEDYHKKVTDKTCCVHAEQRAIMDALKNHPEKISGSTLYFIRIDNNNQITFSGNPYCTICSKMALDTNVKEFVLWHKEGITVYDTQEYNSLSFNYRG